MPTIKLPISFNEQEQAEIAKLIELLNMGGIYGAQAKALKFSITFALSAIQNPVKVYGSLGEAEMGLYFQSVQRTEIRARLLKAAENLANEADKV